MENKKKLTAKQAISLLKNDDIINGYLLPLPSASVSMHYNKGEIIAKIEMDESSLELFLSKEKEKQFILLSTGKETILLEIDEEKIKKLDD